MGAKLIFGAMLLIVVLIAGIVWYGANDALVKAEEARIQEEIEFNITNASFTEGYNGGYQDGWNSAVNVILKAIAEKDFAVIEIELPDGTSQKVKLVVDR